MNAMNWYEGWLVAIGNGMIDSFWWIAAAAAAFAGFLRIARNAVPSRRYFVGVLMLAAVPIPFALNIRLDGFAVSSPAPRLIMQALPNEAIAASFSGTELARPLAMLWIAGVLLLSLRAAGGWLYLRLLVRRATPLDWPALSTLCERMGLRARVELRITQREDSPYTAGWRRPLIIVPIATLAGLPADQLEAIILHELAHIRRCDYLAEWAFQAMETVFFYHPAVWWMTAVLRKERERSCDDMAIAAGVDRGCYAKALVGLEEMRVPAFANGGAGSDLRGRVTRILGEPARSSVWPILVMLSLVILAPLAPLAVAQPSTPYQKWVNQDAAYLIQPEERRAFESLRTDEERQRFIEQFWTRRDPTPGTEVNELKEEHYRRIAYANERFKDKGSDKSGWMTERGRIYIIYGPPDEIESHPSENYEQWRYKHIQGVGNNVIFEFGSRLRK